MRQAAKTFLTVVSQQHDVERPGWVAAHIYDESRPAGIRDVVSLDVGAVKAHEAEAGSPTFGVEDDEVRRRRLAGR